LSILPTFYKQLLRQNYFAKTIQIQTVSRREKLCKTLMFKKATIKMLVKSTLGNPVERQVINLVLVLSVTSWVSFGKT